MDFLEPVNPVEPFYSVDPKKLVNHMIPIDAVNPMEPVDHFDHMDLGE